MLYYILIYYSIEKISKEPLITTPKKSNFNPKKFNTFIDDKENMCPSMNLKQSLCKKLGHRKLNGCNSTTVPTTSNSSDCIEKMSQEYASAEAMIQLHNSFYQTTPQQLFRDSTNAVSRENNEIPKKRWLKKAVLDQQGWESSQDLAQPLNWGDDSRLIECENQKRPSVLVRLEKPEKTAAIALVELHNSTKHYDY